MMDDSISRQAVIDTIEKILPADPMHNEYTQGITCGAALAMEYIKQLPPIQQDYDLSGYSDRLWQAAYERGKAEAEVKHGEWIKIGDHAYRCSVCGKVSCCMGDYCPDCGAKMRKETDGRTKTDGINHAN